MPQDHPLTLVSSNLLFRYAIPLRALKKPWAAEGWSLAEEYRLPTFGAFEGQPLFATVAAAWSTEGLAFDVSVRGKKLPLKCAATRLTESDGVQIWIDTRNMQSVHRASRFCHWFAYLPTGGGQRQSQPWGTMLKINRAKEDAKSFQGFTSLASSTVARDGYRLSFFIPANALTGWNTDEHRRIGFNYAVVDNELGWQTLAADFRLPIAENPSLWHTLELQ
jgi:hypothetical protein